MIKQIYRLLSVLIISNILFSPAVLAKSQKDPNTPKRSLIQRIFHHKKANNQQTNNNQNTNIQKPTYDDDGGYVTKYGVYFNDDMYKTYPPVKPDNK